MNSKVQILTEFVKNYKIQNYTRNEVIIRADEDVRWIYYVDEGYVRQVVTDFNGDELTLHIFAPETYIYVAWAFGQTHNRYDFITLTPVRLRRIPINDIKKHLENNPVQMADLAVRLSRGVNTMALRMESMVFGTSDVKVASVLLLLARRFGKNMDGKMILQLPLTHRLIATLAGLARETVSAEMSRFKQEGWIDNYRKFLEIKDIEKLHQMTNLGDDLYKIDYD